MKTTSAKILLQKWPRSYIGFPKRPRGRGKKDAIHDVGWLQHFFSKILNFCCFLEGPGSPIGASAHVPAWVKKFPRTGLQDEKKKNA